MANYDIKTLQQRILKILLAVDKVCREQNIRYYLWAGTQLGAVRHGGFIPWDDDMDIAMPRPDYERFIAHFREWLPEQFEVVCADNDPSYSFGFAKVLDANTTVIEREAYFFVDGIYIDIFPLDGIPSNKLLRRWQILRYKYYARINYMLHRNAYKHGKGPRSWMPLIVQKLYSHQGVVKAMKKVMTTYEYDKCDYIIDYDDGFRGPQPKSFTGAGKPCQFEGETLIGVAEPEKYLAQKYGDYMTIPPVDKQKQHNFYYLDLEHSYKDFDPNSIKKP